MNLYLQMMKSGGTEKMMSFHIADAKKEAKE